MLDREWDCDHIPLANEHTSTCVDYLFYENHDINISKQVIDFEPNTSVDLIIFDEIE